MKNPNEVFLFKMCREFYFSPRTIPIVELAEYVYDHASEFEKFGLKYVSIYRSQMFLTIGTKRFEIRIVSGKFARIIYDNSYESSIPGQESLHIPLDMFIPSLISRLILYWGNRHYYYDYILGKKEWIEQSE